MIIFDTETTGLPKPKIVGLEKQPKIWEFAAIKLDDKTLEEVDRIQFLVNPKEKLSNFIKKLCKVTDSDLIEQPTFIHFYYKLVEFFIGEKYLIAHNVSFDMNLLCFELQRLGRLTQFPYPPVQICTVNNTINIKGYKLKLGILYQHLFGDEFKDAHRAMADTEALTRIVKELIKLEYIKIKY